MAETTAYAYPSTFAAESSSSAGIASSNPSAAKSNTSPIEGKDYGRGGGGGGFASFICHVAHLEKALQSEESFFDETQRKAISRTRLGYGASFLVDRVQLPNKGLFAVIKTVRQTDPRPTQWRDVLLEIRVLLHKPIRYHPNIVRLLDIGWDNSSEIASPFPALIQEYAEFGTLARLQQQKDRGPLPFSIKQKLCYDVGRGLSILHACGIVHGDLKHENVLVFANRYPQPAGQPFTAKVADFGGSVMDVVVDGSEGAHSIPMNTFPYEAPEIGKKLTVDGVKKTDAFSYGMLIWRCMLDCHDVLAAVNFTISPGRPSQQDRDNLNRLKTSDQLLEMAIASLSKHTTTRDLPRESLGLIITSLLFTLRGDPSQRALDRAQTRTRGMTASESQTYVYLKDVANKKLEEGQRRRTPGRHGIDMDSVGYALGRVAGDDYDAQNNLPGYRPDLPHPEKGGFLFEPLKLRRLLDWEQQREMVAEFVSAAAARSPAKDGGDGMEPWSASFFLYQSFLSGFGVAVDGAEACRWLRSAARPSEETATVDYLAGAWLVRAHRALGVTNPWTEEEQMSSLYWGLIRGHRHCLFDAQDIMMPSMPGGSSNRAEAEDQMKVAFGNYLLSTCGTGLPLFISRRLTRRWDTEDVSALDEMIRAELGDAYESSLRSHAGDSSSEPDAESKLLDGIYVNHKGHGLLHLAASLGRLETLKHLHRKYRCDLNLSNQSHSDTPLTCACRSANLGCALYLLENGADANGTEFGEESPLHCIANFTDAEIDVVVPRLVRAGADIEKHTRASRKDVRRVLADWEDAGSMRLTPLGRAVLLQSLPAVKALLDHGADPWGTKSGGVQPVQLAAVLTLPHILQAMLSHPPSSVAGSEPGSGPTSGPGSDRSMRRLLLFDECEMLRKAHSGELTPYDSLSLQSRIIRCGFRYKEYLAQTLRILRDRRRELGLAADELSSSYSSSADAQLCAEIELGNKDIVEALLNLGHDVDGSASHRPVRAAVAANDEDIFFSVLIRRRPCLSFSDDDDMSLLAVAASRPRHTPRGTRIVEYLLSHGISPETSRDDGGPSALALAIKNGYFELADLLLPVTSVESINSRHVWREAGGDSESVLGFLLSSHTNSSVRAVEYLAAEHEKTSSSLRIHPLVNETKRWSAVHAVAGCRPSEWNEYSQISARIVRLVLDLFPTPDALGGLHVHPTMGTPLTTAVLAGNKITLAMLMDSSYREDLNRSVNVEYHTGDVKASESLTPGALAANMARSFIHRLDSGDDVSTVTAEDMTKAEVSLEIAVHLNKVNNNNKPKVPDETSDLHEMKIRLDAIRQRVKKEHDDDASQDPACSLPVDLSFICEEKASGWYEGVEMTEVMAHRTFLKTFRTADGSFGDGVTGVMDKAFNKRPAELRSAGTG
ncbi:hypothetical protein CP532_6829 [Ophiocordyceps camponoti-leonardi (nom. inval.)]|nr:hypothetical protein CP532_6829 [Ophiocordyceps camponoti-leonardi (nom. inval.)]